MILPRRGAARGPSRQARAAGLDGRDIIGPILTRKELGRIAVKEEDMRVRLFARPLQITAVALAASAWLGTPGGHGSPFAVRRALPPVAADEVEPLAAQVVATGIPGAGAICQIGTFHLGGPFHDNPALSPATAPGQILDGKRLLVASTSNFGAPLARADQAAGSVLSIDLGGGPVAVPADFAVGGGQAGALGGRVRLYTANSPA